MQRPKGRELQEGEILRAGDMYGDRPGFWGETQAAGRRVPARDVGYYIRPGEEPDSLSSPEPAPTDGEGPPIWDLVVADMKERDAFGREKYGRPLRAADGRKTLRDAYQEALDLAVYLRKAIYESEGR